MSKQPSCCVWRIMRGKNNLGDGWYNTYWKVKRGFKVYARVGHLNVEKVNSYCFNPPPVYQEMKLKSGYQIHDLYGGVFCVTKLGIARKIRVFLDDREEHFPVSCLERIVDEEDFRKPKKYLNDEFHKIYDVGQLESLGFLIEK